MKGGGITVGGIVFSGQDAAMDWARIHLPPNTYQCIGGMNYAMCLILEAVVHQEDMMKREEHGERVKRTFMQSAQVLSVYSSYPPVLDGAKAAFLWPGIVCNNHNHEFSDTLINQIFHEQQPSNFRRNTIPPLAIIFAINWSVGYWWRRSGY
jgi:hypothetical protein